jgi:hypothetical protein
MNKVFQGELSRRALLALLGTAAGWAQIPYKGKSAVPPQYESPVPRRVEHSAAGEVRIGFFGPDQPEHPGGHNLDGRGACC